MEKITERILAFNKDYRAGRTLYKLAAMSKNSFRFFRGTNHVFYEDMSSRYPMPDSPAAWICGDLHPENFGTYKSDNRLVYFDLNDFDEAVLAPVSLELIRMVTGIFVAFSSLQIDGKKALNIAQLFVDSYARTLAAGKTTYIETKTATGILQHYLKAAEKRKHKKMLAKKTVDGKPGRQLSLKYDSHKKLEPALRTKIIEHVTAWLKYDDNSPYNYKAVDAVFRLAGAGSVGINRYAVLLESLNDKGDKYKLLDMKQARSPSLLPYIRGVQPCWQHEAERVVAIQQRMQNRSPALLSATVFLGDAYVMEEMQSAEDKIDFKLLKHDYREMCRLTGDMGALTAAAQLRSSGRQGSAIPDQLIYFGQQTDWQSAILEQAQDYAHEMNKYYLQFIKDNETADFKNQLKLKTAFADK